MQLRKTVTRLACWDGCIDLNSFWRVSEQNYEFNHRIQWRSNLEKWCLYVEWSHGWRPTSGLQVMIMMMMNIFWLGVSQSIDHQSTVRPVSCFAMRSIVSDSIRANKLNGAHYLSTATCSALFFTISSVIMAVWSLSLNSHLLLNRPLAAIRDHTQAFFVGGC